jgi:hypothetical protein
MIGLCGKKRVFRVSVPEEDKRELYMKVSRISSLLLGSSLLFAVNVFAGNTIKKSLHLSESVTVEGTKLAPGDYKVEWSGSGPDVKLNILKGKETVATVPARIVPESTSNSQDGYALRSGADGSQSISEIFFTGEKYDLEIGQASNANTPQGANPSGSN